MVSTSTSSTTCVESCLNSDDLQTFEIIKSDSELMKEALLSVQISPVSEIIREDLIGLLEFLPKPQIESLSIERRQIDKKLHAAEVATTKVQ